MVLVGGGMALAGWFNGRVPGLRALCIGAGLVITQHVAVLAHQLFAMLINAEELTPADAVDPADDLTPARATEPVNSTQPADLKSQGGARE